MKLGNLQLALVVALVATFGGSTAAQSPVAKPSVAKSPVAKSPETLFETDALEPNGSVLRKPSVVEEPIVDNFEVHPEEYAYDDSILPNPEAWFQSGVWYTQEDVMVIHRSRPEERAIGRDLSSGRRFNQYGQSIGVEPAFRFTLGLNQGTDGDKRNHSWELTYLGLLEFDSEDSIESIVPGALISTIDPVLGGFTGADVFTAEYKSQLNSFELNKRIRRTLPRDTLLASPDGSWTRAVTGGMTPSLLLGVRAVSLDERYDFQGRRNGVSQNVFSGDWRAETDNQLWGLQIGGDCIDQRETWYWGIKGKAGVFANFTEQTTRISVNDAARPSPDVFMSADDTDVAFFGEFGIFAAYQFWPNMTVRAGYDFMAIAGVALAPEQLVPPQPIAVVNSQGDIIYHGLSLGLEMTW